MDQLLLDWARERPDLDFTPAGVITRLARARTYLDAELRAVFARFGLTAADFAAIIALRRSSPRTRCRAACSRGTGAGHPHDLADQAAGGTTTRNS